MATWHQTNGAYYAGAYRPNRTSFVLVEDPPSNLCTRIAFETRAEALAYVDRRVDVYKNAQRDWFTIVPPTGA